MASSLETTPISILCLITRLLPLNDLVNLACLTSAPRLRSTCRHVGGVTEACVTNKTDSKSFLTSYKWMMSLPHLRVIFVDYHESVFLPTGWAMALPRQMVEITIRARGAFSSLLRRIDLSVDSDYESFIVTDLEANIPIALCDRFPNYGRCGCKSGRSKKRGLVPSAVTLSTIFRHP